jgi:dTMP kinase
MAVNPGYLVALEGIDGSGKTTQQRRLAAALRAAGHRVVSTTEPTDGPAGRRIRELARSTEAPAAEEELRLFLEDRREHVDQVLAPALAAGEVVITDRYFLSTVAYQGARGLDPRELLEQSEARFPVPDLALLFEVTPQLGVERLIARAGVAEPAFERLDFLIRVAEVYAQLDRPYIERVEAARPPDAVHDSVLEIVRRRLGLVLSR